MADSESVIERRERHVIAGLAAAGMAWRMRQAG